MRTVLCILSRKVLSLLGRPAAHHVLAAKVIRMHILLGLRALHLHVDQTAGLLKRLLQGLRQPLPDPFLYH